MRRDAESAVFVQNIYVSFETAVCFTHDLFRPDNPVLAGVLKPTGTRPIKLLAIVESSIAMLRPDLTAAIAEYARQHEIEPFSMRRALLRQSHTGEFVSFACQPPFCSPPAHSRSVAVSG